MAKLQLRDRLAPELSYEEWNLFWSQIVSWLEPRFSRDSVSLRADSDSDQELERQTLFVAAGRARGRLKLFMNGIGFQPKASSLASELDEEVGDFIKAAVSSEEKEQVLNVQALELASSVLGPEDYDTFITSFWSYFASRMNSSWQVQNQFQLFLLSRTGQKSAGLVRQLKTRDDLLFSMDLEAFQHTYTVSIGRTVGASGNHVYGLLLSYFNDYLKGTELAFDRDSWEPSLRDRAPFLMFFKHVDYHVSPFRRDRFAYWSHLASKYQSYLSEFFGVLENAPLVRRLIYLMLDQHLSWVDYSQVDRTLTEGTIPYLVEDFSFRRLDQKLEKLMKQQGVTNYLDFEVSAADVQGGKPREGGTLLDLFLSRAIPTLTKRFDDEDLQTQDLKVPSYYQKSLQHLVAGSSRAINYRLSSDFWRSMFLRSRRPEIWFSLLNHLGFQPGAAGQILPAQDEVFQLESFSPVHLEFFVDFLNKYFSEDQRRSFLNRADANGVTLAHRFFELLSKTSFSKAERQDLVLKLKTLKEMGLDLQLADNHSRKPCDYLSGLLKRFQYRDLLKELNCLGPFGI